MSTRCAKYGASAIAKWMQFSKNLFYYYWASTARPVITPATIARASAVQRERKESQKKKKKAEARNSFCPCPFSASYDCRYKWSKWWNRKTTQNIPFFLLFSSSASVSALPTLINVYVCTGREYRVQLPV